MLAGPQINMRHLLEFCKLKFPADEYKSIVTEFAGLKVRKDYLLVVRVQWLLQA